MAKFSVGEKCLFVGPVENTMWGDLALPLVVFVKKNDHRSDINPACIYEVGPGFPTRDGMAYVKQEHLRPIPPAQDSTEDPALTRLKRVLEQDAPQLKPVKA